MRPALSVDDTSSNNYINAVFVDVRNNHILYRYIFQYDLMARPYFSSCDFLPTCKPWWFSHVTLDKLYLLIIHMEGTRAIMIIMAMFGIVDNHFTLIYDSHSQFSFSVLQSTILY